MKMDYRDWFPILWRERHRALEACAGVTAEEWKREHGFASGSLRSLFAHIVECERGWVTEDLLREPYARLEAAELDRLYADPAAARARSEEVATVTRRALEALVPSSLAEKRGGLDRDNKPATFTVEEIFLHLCTHELRHQGQAQAMLRLLGKKAPNLDWI